MRTGRMVCVFLWGILLLPARLGAADGELRKDLEARRARIMEKMDGEGMLLLFGGEPKHKTGDVDYEFRQESNIYYLTGVAQRGIALVLMPENQTHREILFLPKRNPAQEIWTGRTLSADEAREISGIPNVWDAEELEPYLNSVLYGGTYRQSRYSSTDEYQRFSKAVAEQRAKVYLLLENRPGLKGKLSREYQFASDLRQRFPGVQPVDAAPFIHSLRMVKSPYELAQLRRAIDISCEAQHEAMRAAGPGKWEYEIESLIEAVFKRNNAFDWAYPSIVGAGPNSTTLHYEKSNRQMQDGELLLMDVGAEYNYYAADVTRTIPVNGRFSKEQKEIYELVFEAQEEAFKVIRPGVTLVDVHRRAADVIRGGLSRLGLVTDKSGEQYRMFFMHGTSHFLGLDVHDVGNRFAPLQPGMVFTVEPGVYVREDVLDNLERTPENLKLIETIQRVVGKYKNIGVRIEDDVLVTSTGYELLSAKAPRTIADLEKIMSR